jgi:hypothetical protein
VSAARAPASRANMGRSCTSRQVVIFPNLALLWPPFAAASASEMAALVEPPIVAAGHVEARVLERIH